MKSRAYLLTSPVLLLSLLPVAVAQTSQTPASTQPAQTQTATTPPAQSPSPSTTQPAAPQPADTSSGQVSAPTDSLPPAPDQTADNNNKQDKKTKEKRDGGINDIDDIGNRKIGGGKGLGNWYSLEKEIQMGKMYAQQVEASVKLVQDPVVTEYVNRIGQNLVRNSDAKVPFTIKVVDSDEINAF